MAEYSPPPSPPFSYPATNTTQTQQSNINNARILLKNLLNMLEQQEVSLFSICSDDVSPSVRPHLQAAKSFNMYEERKRRRRREDEMTRNTQHETHATATRKTHATQCTIAQRNAYLLGCVCFACVCALRLFCCAAVRVKCC